MLDEVLIRADGNLWEVDGESVCWPVALAGDKGYRANWIDDYLLELDIRPVIPSKENEVREDRPVAFDKEA